MARFAAFLRGINVGGRRVKKADLCAPFEALGHTDVVSFRASGNVVFESAERSAAKLTKALEAELERSLGYEVRTMLRSAAQLRQIASREPFPGKAVTASKGKLQVLLLAEKPTAAALERALELGSEVDRIAVSETELYWLPSGGTQDSPLDQEALNRALGTGTMRTMGTIEQIASKYFA